MNGKFVPYQNLTKKKRRELDRAKRGSWGDIKPVTRRAERSDAYDRKAENRRWRSETRRGTDNSGGFSFQSSSMRSILKITGRVPSLQQAIIIFSSFVQPRMIDPPCKAA